MSLRRMLPFILINIVVSATVVLVILFWWDRRVAVDEPGVVGETAVIQATPFVQPNAPGVDDNAFLQPVDTPTPEPIVEEGPPVHVVSAGDTLGSISGFYDVTLEDLMVANDITNPNLIAIGQQLIIPIGGIPTTTPIPTSTPVVLPSPIATDIPASDGEAIVRITDLFGAGELADEVIQLTNNGSRQVALLNWQLSDEDGHLFTFEQVTLFGDGAAIQIHTTIGQKGPADLYWGLDEAIWQSGETATLRNGDGLVINTYIVP